MDRSIEKDFDISYHTRAMIRCLEDYDKHVDALLDVEYIPLKEVSDGRVTLCKLQNWLYDYDK